ncbi:putative membrane protein YfcA [Trueperella bonasi]|uniref:Probable membrane transporter protein n=1 Tax=Trueperella bonasi TaxID=312286 RepID=A0ABT9NEH7_9ACTO|nr:sulfite exporter TauE/SafE family protein [Trueperella bonasi]MDP9805786.1 putative membrane protein YfcA [Trueperella bonasi]
MELFISAVAGIGIGIVVGMLGAGGGILSVPALVYLLGQSPHEAAAGSLVIVLLSALTSLIAHARHGHVNWKGGLIFASVSAFAALAGARIAPLLSGTLLMVLFSALLLCVAALMLIRGLRERAREPRKRSRKSNEANAKPQRSHPQAWKIILAGTAVGLMSGIFGVGGGFAVVPLLVLAFGLPMLEATGTSVLVMFVASIFGLLGRIGTPVQIDWPIVLIFAAGSAIGGLFGEPISRRARVSTLTLAFGVLLLTIGSFTAVQNLTNL